MENIINFLKEKNWDYDLGIINNGIFHKLEIPFEDTQVIRFKWKKGSIKSLISNLDKMGSRLIEISSDDYSALYKIDGTDNKVFVIYAVDSHVQIPKFMLERFRTGDHLYYINTVSNKIIESSPKNYNAEFGYYSLFFEEYLSANYENDISDFIRQIEPLVFGEVDDLVINNFKNIINRIFYMAYVRNPQNVKDINNISYTSILFEGGFDTEFITRSGEDLINEILTGFTPMLLVNKIEKNFVTTKSLVSNLYIKDNCACMVLLLHPKFAIALLPNDYYKRVVEEVGKDSCLGIINEEGVLEMNKQIYRFAKKYNDDVIGKKAELEELIYLIYY